MQKLGNSKICQKSESIYNFISYIIILLHFILKYHDNYPDTFGNRITRWSTSFLLILLAAATAGCSYLGNISHDCELRILFY